MNKKRIAICNLLKPVDEPRCFEKFAYSLGKGNKYEINIIGYASKSKKTLSNVRLHPIFNFKRNHPKRVVSGFMMFRKLIEVKPEIIIVNSSELLLVIAIYKILFGAKIIYDIQEDIYKNIRCRSDRNKVLRLVLSNLMRSKESMLTPFFDHFIVAEKIYSDDISFLKSKTVVSLTNTFNQEFFGNLPKSVPQSSKIPSFIFAGTIAEEFGVFDALKLVKRLYETDHSVSLVIIGQYHDVTTLERIRESIEDEDYIENRISDSFIDHTHIIEAIKAADYGLSSYQNIPCIRGKEPTTLFEYIGLKKPVLINSSSVGTEMVEEFDAGLCIDFQNPPKDLLARLKGKEFYRNGNSSEALWMTENHSNLLRLLENL
ncbi:MAG: glycosyltransferase [Bacteroidota bacterium]